MWCCNDDSNVDDTAKPTTTRTEIKSTATISNSPLPGKRGVCFSLNPDTATKKGTWEENLPKIRTLEPYWSYTWGFDGYDHLKDLGIHWVPMSWNGSTVDKLNAVLDKANIRSLIADGTIQLFLAFNEPDRKDQSNMTVATVIELWPVLQSLNVPLVSPACASPGGPWMEEFMNEITIRNYRVDYIAVHWYGGSSFDGFRNKMTEYYNKYKIPLIITEFAPADWNAKSIDDNKLTDQKVLDFMKQALPWIERTDWIIGYAWFSFGKSSNVGCKSALFELDGSITPLGRYYHSVRTETPDGDQSIHL